MSARSLLGALWGAPDRRPRREVEDEIAAELEFHLACATDEFVRAGASRDDARRQAVAKFGDVGAIRGQCARERMGERIMLQRVLLGAVAVLVVAVVVLGMQVVASRERAAAAQAELLRLRIDQQMLRNDSAGDLERMKADAAALPDHIASGQGTLSRILKEAEAKAGERAAIRLGAPGAAQAYSADDWEVRFLQSPDDAGRALELAEELKRTSHPLHAVQVVEQVYPLLGISAREQLLRVFASDGAHAFALRVLHLGAKDPEPSVRERAFVYLRNFAFVDFAAAPEAYEAWHRQWGEFNPGAVFADGARVLAERLRSESGDELERDLRFLAEVDFSTAHAQCPYFGAELRRLGVLELAQAWVESDAPRRAADGLRACGWMRLPADELRASVLARLQHNPVRDEAEVWSAYCKLVGQRGNSWAVDSLAAGLCRRMEAGERGPALSETATALAEIGDARAIPYLIAALKNDDSEVQRQALGQFGLRALTGVGYDESHSAEWWANWWEQNRERFPGAGPTIGTFSSMLFQGF